MTDIQCRINNHEIVGKELILDIHNCSIETFTKESIENFLIKLCEEIDMERQDQFSWEYIPDSSKPLEEVQHLAGFSFVQFISTSGIVCHTYDTLNKCSLNIYSCKDFSEDEAAAFCTKWFKGSLAQRVCIERK